MIKDKPSYQLFKKITQGQERFPLQGQWELTYRCNLRCVMCYTECFDTPERLQKELSLDEIDRIIEELSEAGVMFLTLTGGEPLAHRNFKEIYTKLTKKGIRLTIYSNGTLIAPEIADLWESYPPEMVEISMHGLGENFEKVTAVKGSFERCLRGVKLLSERKVPLTLKTVGMTFNKEEILEIKKYVESMGNIHWYLGEEMRPELNGSPMPLQYQLTQSDFGEIASQDAPMLDEHKKITQMLKREENLSPEDKKKNRCASKFKFHIDPYGGMQLCSGNRRKTYDLRIGSFREGFYQALPDFPCPKKPVLIKELIYAQETKI